MADKRIIDLTETSSLSSSDYLMSDNSSTGSKKISYSNLLGSDLTLLNTKVTALEDNVASYDGDIENLQTAVTSLQGSVTTLQSSIATATNNISSLQTEMSGKQNTLTFDNTPTISSSNPVTSGGVYSAIPVESGTGVATVQTKGANNTVSGDNSTALGDGNTVSGAEASAIGETNTVSVKYGNALGKNNVISGDGSIAAGQGNTVYGKLSSAFGTNNTVGVSGTATYYQNAFGNGNIITATNANAMGQINTVSGSRSFAVGNRLIASGQAQLVAGQFNVDDSTKQFILGYGSSVDNRKNTFTVDYDGNVTCNNIPAPPASNGTYVLKCTVSNGTATYAWVAG